MAVVFGYPKPLPSAPSSADESQYRHVLRFLVVTNDPDDGDPVALAATGIPRVGHAHPTQSFAYCKRVYTEPDPDSRLKFTVVAEYETPPRGTNPGGDNPDPLLRTPDYSWQWVTRNEPIRFAKFTKIIKVKRDGSEAITSSGVQTVARYPVQNSALVAFDPLPERSVSTPVLKVERNQASFLASDANNYVDHVNFDQFTVAGNIITAGQAYMQSITATRQFENDIYYWRVSYELHFQPQGWTVDLLDHGDHETVWLPAQGGNGAMWVRRPIGTELPVDSNLDGAGAKLEIPAFGSQLPGDVLAVFLRYEYAPTAVFANLGL